MKRQVRLYIGGQEADLSEGDLILFNYTLEELTNPTVVKNSYTQQVTLKGTPTNNDIFGHIWRLDRDQRFGGSTGPDFDPSRKTGFQLFDGTGNLLESGYVKLDTITRHGADIQYSVTLYGGLGSFLYGLSFDSEGNQKSLASLDYLGTGNPDRELDFTIEAATVQAAWDRLIANPEGVNEIWDVINFAPCYNGYPDRFGADKGLIKPTEQGLPATHPEDATYGTLNGWSLLTMTRSMTEWETKDLRSYLQRPVVSVKAVLNAIAKPTNNGGYAFDASVLDDSDYDGMWVTLPLLPSLDSYKNVQQTIVLSVDGTTHNDSFSSPVSIGTSLQVGSKVDVSLNIAFGATVTGATATPLQFAKSAYSRSIDGTTERYDFSGFFAQLVAYDSQDRKLAASKVICVGASEDYGQFDKDGKVRADACGYTPQMPAEYSFVESVLIGGSGSYQLANDLNLTVSCYNAATYRIWIHPYHFRKTIHFGAIYRKTWRSHALGTNAMFVYNGSTEYTYTAMRLSSGSAGSTASYKTPESVRSGAAISKAMLLSTDYTPADFLLGIVKSLGLYLHYDNVSKAVTLMSRNEYFRQETIDLQQRIDRGREISIAPIAFDTKWLDMTSPSIGGGFEQYYTDVYGQQYGEQRIGTGYDFNSESKDIMDSVVFRSGAQAVENSRYFNDVEAGGHPVSSQLLDAGNKLTYVNAAGDTSDYEVPVVSSPTIEYWGSPSFDDVQGYDWLTAWKLQCHDTEGKPVDGSGVLLFRVGMRQYDRFHITDDLPEMMSLNDGTPCWRMDEGEGLIVPVFARYKTSAIYKLISTAPYVAEYMGEGVMTSLDFGRVQELNSPHMDYFPGKENVTAYEKMWRAYFRDRYDINTRVVTAWVNMAGIQVGAESLRKFYYFDGSVWSLNRVINYSVTTDDPVQCEFVKVQDVANYLSGQDFGGVQTRGTLDLTVSPANANVLIDGSTVILSEGHGTFNIRTGQHLVEVSLDGYSTASEVVTIREDETTTVTIELTAGQRQLYITVDPPEASPVISMTVNGQATAYVAGVNIADGAAVNVTVTASGYVPQTRQFTMSEANANQYFLLVVSAQAAITPVGASIGQPSQNVVYNISDPDDHGWILDFDGPDSYSRITGAGVTSGSATVDGVTIRGTGAAVVYLTVPANPNAYTRTIDNSPFYFQDSTTGTRTSLWINQLGTQDSQVAVTSITLNKTSLSLPKGSSQKLTATVLPSNATNKNVVWSSNNTSIVQVGQDGTVYAIAQGTASVRATASDGSGVYATCSVSVLDATVPVTGVTVSPSSLSLAIGSTTTVAAVITPQNASNKAVTWRTTAPTIATIDQYGVVTGVGKGACRVYATTYDGGFESYCSINVTNSSSMSATNVTAKAAATSGSSVLTVTGVSPSSIHASTTATWVTGVTVDTSGSPYRVRLTFGQNASSRRTATITVTGTGTSGEISTTFVLTQNAPSTSDVPVNSMTIVGDATIMNSANASHYEVAFDPATTTQNKVIWSLTGSSYASLANTADGACDIVLTSGASGQTVTLTATNYYNNAVVATKTITINYVTPGSATVTPSSVIVEAAATTDNTPIVTASGYDVTTLTTSVAGFITSASIQGERLVTVFGQNTGAERYGQVTLYRGSTQVAIVTYTQEAAAVVAYGIDIEALRVYQSADSLGRPICYAKFRVAFSNPNTYDDVVANPYATLVGYDGNGNVVLTKGWQLEDKIVAAISTEQEVYTEQWQGTLPTIDHYTITITSSTVTDSYTGTGDDIIA